METTFHPTLIPFLKNKHLLLDTNVFRDSANRSSIFRDFFNELKNNGVTLTTIDLVKYELLKGSQNDTKYKEKEALINEIIDIPTPIVPNTFILAYELIREYGIDGAALHITDLLLGAVLKQYKENIALLTRDTSDFVQSVFSLQSVVNIPYSKGIWTYGVYQYSK